LKNFSGKVLNKQQMNKVLGGRCPSSLQDGTGAKCAAYWESTTSTGYALCYNSCVAQQQQ